VAFFSIHFGRHVDDHIPPTRHIKPLPARWRWISLAGPLLWLVVLITFACTIHTTSFIAGRRVVISLLFAPFGTFPRWILGFKCVASSRETTAKVPAQTQP
jgi:hypothetical protein